MSTPWPPKFKRETKYPIRDRLTPEFLRQPIWWWLKPGYKDEGLRDRLESLGRKWHNVRPRPVWAWRTFYQRGRQGYAFPRDIWSLDYYLLGWLPEAVDDLRKDSHGHPAGLCTCAKDNSYNCTPKGDKCDGPEIWDGILTEIAEGLRAGRAIENLDYFDVRDTPENNRAREKELHRQFRKSWKLMGKWFFALWD